MPALLTDPNAWAALVTLTTLEVVLGIDNVIFISILVGRLDAASGRRARQVGLLLAFVFRVALLFALTTLARLRYPVVTVLGNEISWHDVILVGGGLFLIAKATFEIHGEIDGDEHERPPSATGTRLFLVIVQIGLIDIVFSIDSIVTAIGMAQHIEVMIAAIVIAMLVMYAAADAVGDFILRHPTTKMLALSFLILIGVALIADGFDVHIPRGYIYFAMAFAAAVEAVNILVRQRRRARGPQ
ncbi:MAG TPA: TerC family protein [Xanthobacteraceae bacterium]|nr:TerC family protein [Xanthobacteraceae bacterium]